MTWDKYRLADALKHIVDSNREFTTWTISTPHLLLLLKKAVEEEREAVLITVDELMGSEKDRHPMFSDGYDYALGHIEEFVKGRANR